MVRPGTCIPGPPLLALLLVAGATAVAAQQAPRIPPAEQAPRAAPLHPAWLGVSYEVRWTQQDGRCDPQVLIDGVVQGSPAERAGLRSGDAIVALNGQPLPAARIDFIATRLHPGDSVRLRIDRDGQLRDVLAVAGPRPARPPAGVVSGSRAGRGTPGPTVHVEGGTLVARNVEPGGGRDARGYWFTTGEGRTEYRRLGSWAQDDLDARVVRLLRCAEEVSWQPARTATVDYRQVQRRADSLRVVITRRTLEHAELEALAATSTAPGRSQLPGHAPRTLAPSEDRGVAGAELAPLEPELADYFRNAREGLLVLRVAPGSPAASSGLRPGDVIVEANGRRLETIGELRTLLSFPDPQPVQLRVIRKGRVRGISLPRS